MSDIRNQITDAMKNAMRAKDQSRLTAIRMIQAAIKQFEIDNRDTPVTDQVVLSILNKLAKQRRDSITQFDAANRKDLADKERSELAILQEFMPTQISAADLEKLIQKTVADLGANSVKDMARVMVEIKKQVDGRADMALVGQLVKLALS